MGKKTSRVESKVRSFKLAFPPGRDIDIGSINAGILAEVEAKGIKAVMAYAEGDRAVTLEELAESGIDGEIPADGTEVVKTLTFDFKDDSLFVKALGSRVPLARMKLTIGYQQVDGDGSGDGVSGPGDKKEYIADVFVVTKSENASAGEPG